MRARRRSAARQAARKGACAASWRRHILDGALRACASASTKPARARPWRLGTACPTRGLEVMPARRRSRGTGSRARTNAVKQASTRSAATSSFGFSARPQERDVVLHVRHLPRTRGRRTSRKGCCAAAARLVPSSRAWRRKSTACSLSGTLCLVMVEDPLDHVVGPARRSSRHVTSAGRAPPSRTVHSALI